MSSEISSAKGRRLSLVLFGTDPSSALGRQFKSGSEELIIGCPESYNDRKTTLDHMRLILSGRKDECLKRRGTVRTLLVRLCSVSPAFRFRYRQVTNQERRERRGRQDEAETLGRPF